jgi:hypothetical protein
MSMKYIYVLLGGMIGPDGILDSIGIEALAARLREWGVVKTYTWTSWEQAGLEMTKVQVGSKVGENKIVLIGYSGGGSRATWLANTRFGDSLSRPMIDLLITLDPSPQHDMKPFRANVLRAVNFYNTMQDLAWPGVGKLGGGALIGAREVEEIKINMPHLAVQTDPGIQDKVIELVKEV